MEMIIKDVTVHTVEGFSTVEDLISFMEERPLKNWDIEGEKAVWRINDTRIKESEHYEIARYDFYKIDIDVLNINKIVCCDCWSMIETKDGKIHVMRMDSHDFGIMFFNAMGINWISIGF